MPNFRKMTEQDAENIAALEKEIFTDPWTCQSIQETFAQKQAFVTVAEKDSKVIGYCIMYYAIDEGEIARIAIDDTVRRQGIGRKLLDYTCECCLEKGIERLLLDVRESNVGAKKFYEQYGFETDGIRKQFYDMPKEDAVLMSKVLV